MKNVAIITLLSILMAGLVSAAPASFQDPAVQITPGTCVVYETHGVGADKAKDTFVEELENGDWLRFFEGDVGNLLESDVAFQGKGQYGSGDVILCQKNGKLTHFPNIVVIEFWGPGEGMPESCTHYNDNIVELEDGNHAAKDQYLFLDGQGNSYFKGAGFYGSCGQGTQDPSGTGNMVSTVEKVIVAGNSEEALLKTAKTFAKALEKSDPSQYASGVMYQMDDDWATTAIVYTEEDRKAAEELKKEFCTTTNHVLGDCPLMVSESADTALAPYLLSPGKNHETLFGLDWLNPDTKGHVKLVASASSVFSNMTTLPAIMFGEVNSKNSKERIYNATAYGCKESGSVSLGEFDDQPVYNDGQSFTASGPYTVKYNIDSEEKSEIFVVKEDNGKVYSGKDGLVCSFTGSKKVGSCEARIQQSTERSSDPDAVGNLPDYCVDSGTPAGNAFEYGVYWDDYPTEGGKVELYGGFVPCATYGMVVEDGEYFSALLADEKQRQPLCSELETTNGEYRCPYKETGQRVNGKGIGWDQWCACVEPDEDVEWPGISAPDTGPPGPSGSTEVPESEEEEAQTCAKAGGQWVNERNCPGTGKIEDTTDNRGDKVCCYTGALNCNRASVGTTVAVVDSKYCPNGQKEVSGQLASGRVCCEGAHYLAVDDCLKNNNGEIRKTDDCEQNNKIEVDDMSEGLTEKGLVCCKKHEEDDQAEEDEGDSDEEDEQDSSGGTVPIRGRGNTGTEQDEQASDSPQPPEKEPADPRQEKPKENEPVASADSTATPEEKEEAKEIAEEEAGRQQKARQKADLMPGPEAAETETEEPEQETEPDVPESEQEPSTEEPQGEETPAEPEESQTEESDKEPEPIVKPEPEPSEEATDLSEITPEGAEKIPSREGFKIEIPASASDDPESVESYLDNSYSDYKDPYAPPYEYQSGSNVNLVVNAESPEGPAEGVEVSVLDNRGVETDLGTTDESGSVLTSLSEWKDNTVLFIKGKWKGTQTKWTNFRKSVSDKVEGWKQGAKEMAQKAKPSYWVDLYFEKTFGSIEEE